VRLLHTSDWHVGRTIRGRTRADEHRAVLAEIAAVADQRDADLVVVAGDLFDTAAPTPDAKRIVTRALSALRGTGADVVAIGGNHDNGAELDALRSWAEAAGVTLRGTVRDRAADHVVVGRTDGGEPWRIVALPFLSQRYAIHATEMFELTAAEANQTYADHISRLIAALCTDPPVDAVNIVTAHLTVVGAKMGGGERDAHTIQSYAVPATVFPASVHYVALGHLHRRQQVQGPAPVHYAGSPLAIDFGEEENSPSVTIVEVSVAKAARTRDVPITSALPLRTVKGTLDELREVDPGERGWLRVFVRERPRAGLREAVQEMLPNALEVRIDPDVLAEVDPASARAKRAPGRSPGELFAEYLTATGHVDAEVAGLFERLHAEVEAGHGQAGLAPPPRTPEPTPTEPTSTGAPPARKNARGAKKAEVS